MSLTLTTDLLTLRTRHPFIIARGGQSEYRTVMVCIRDDDGLEGWGEAAATRFYGETLETVEAVLPRYADELGSDPQQLEGIERRLATAVAGNAAARVAISSALHDLVAKRANLPLCRYWGLDPAQAPRSTFTIGMDTADMVRRKVAESAEYPVLKIKLGGSHDLDLLRTIREATDRELRVDANCGWTAMHAVRMLPVLEEFGVTLLEQPVAPDDLDGLALIRSRASIPVIADESCITARDIPPLVGKVDGINIKLAKCGSLREALRMIAIARAHGMMVMIGCMIESSLGITAAAHLTPLVDVVDLDGAALLAEDPFVGATIDGGQVRIPEAPGARRAAAMNGARIARVALPLPVASPYRYLVPTTLADRALPGARVVVPVRQQEMVGIVLAVEEGEVPAGTRAVQAAPDAVPALTEPLLALAVAGARHWGAPVGMMLRAMLPSALWGRSAVRLTLAGGGPREIGGTAGHLLEWLRGRPEHCGTVTQASRALKRPLWEVVDRLQRIGAVTMDTIPPDTDGKALHTRIASVAAVSLPLAEREARWRRSPAQRRIYEALESAGGRMAVPELLVRAGAGAGPLASLVSQGVVRIGEEPLVRDPFASLPVTPPPTQLTGEQRSALDRLASLPAGEAALLFGVTGSGKTAVYLERIRTALAAGRGAILLVPEIALTPQTVARVRGAFGDAVAVLHSGLTDGERADAWRSLRWGERRVAVGARSAIFAPVERLGVIVLDEEHEASYKNGETPRYHARDVAAMRSRLEGAQLILGSATPSLESWSRSRERDTLVSLPSRIGDRPLPPVELVDLRCERSLSGSDLPWSAILDTAVARALAREEQVLLLLNRRGWASFRQCRDCGAAVECPECSISMTWHRHPDHLRCHYCGRREEAAACRACGGATIQHRGAGTQQLERLLAERFPEARLARMDLDTTTTRWSHHRILGQVESGDIDVLLGTQMIAKGIDFPRVTAVGVVDADLALHLPDFRASERCFQLVAQVAGRAGRGPRGGTVVVQTRQPEHPALQAAARHDAPTFLAQELEARRTPPYPPHTELVRVVASHPDSAQAAARIAALAEWSERAIARSGRRLLVLGPAPCPVERIRNEHRWHLLLKGEAAAVDAWVRTVGPRLVSRRGDVRLTLDRDPVQLL